MSASPAVVLNPQEVLSRPLGATVLRERTGVLLAIAAPVLLLLGTVLTPQLSGSNSAVLAALPRVADQLLAAHLINIVASMSYIATVLVTWRIPERAGSVLRLVGGSVAILGFVSNALGEALDGYAAWAGAKAGVPVGTLARLFDYLDGAPAALPVSWLAIPVATVGGLVMWLGVVRAHRAVPRLGADRRDRRNVDHCRACDWTARTARRGGDSRCGRGDALRRAKRPSLTWASCSPTLQP